MKILFLIFISIFPVAQAEENITTPNENGHRNNEFNKQIAVSELIQLNFQAENIWNRILMCNSKQQDSAIEKYFNQSLCTSDSEASEIKISLKELKGNLISYLASSSSPFAGLGLPQAVIEPHPFFSEILIEIILGIRTNLEIGIAKALGPRAEISTIKLDSYLLFCSEGRGPDSICMEINNFSPANRTKNMLELARTILRSSKDHCSRLGLLPNLALYAFLETNNIWGTHISIHSPLQKEDLTKLSCINAEYKQIVLPKNYLGDRRQQNLIKKKYWDVFHFNL